MTEQPAPRRRARRWIAQALGVSLLTGGALLLTAQMVAPEEVERASSVVVSSVRTAAQEVNTAVTNDLPKVQLGAEASNDAIDTAPAGVFPQMASYKVVQNLQPVFAAHNGSGGDIILNWELGQAVMVTAADGTEQKMIVTDARDTRQAGATTKDIAGMRGSILLQSCYWVEDDMRFVALTPEGETPSAPDQGADDLTPLVIP